MFNLDCSCWSPGIFYVVPTSAGICLYDSKSLRGTISVNTLENKELEELIESSIKNRFHILARIKENRIKFFSTFGKTINDENLEIDFD